MPKTFHQCPMCGSLTNRPKNCLECILFYANHASADRTPEVKRIIEETIDPVAQAAGLTANPARMDGR